MKRILTIVCCFMIISSEAAIKLPLFFSDNMVLQRNQKVPVWGWGSPGERVSVQFNGQTKKTRAGKDGKWTVTLDPMSAGGPYDMIIKGSTRDTIHNILLGEVWICSGQSNMEFTLSAANNAEKEISAANFPQIRQFKVSHAVSSVPLNDVKGGNWITCSPSTAGIFTAVGYFFAKDLYNKLHVPVGLLNTSWGGTIVETWTSREAFENSPEFREMISHMPRVDLDSLMKKKQADMIEKISGTGAMSDKSRGGWDAGDYNAASWPSMELPSSWEQRGLENVDGVVWFRKTITLDASDISGQAVILLGQIDDSDSSYVNGVLVGATENKWNETRKYTIPANTLKPGKNTVSVKVIDNGGGGGIIGQESELKLITGNKEIPLSGNWQYQVEQLNMTGDNINPNAYPTLLFNAMLHPLIPYAIAGVIWYQGESNAGRAYQYTKAFPLMITDWRQRWGNDFPFYFVQLASYNAGNGNSQNGSNWAELREAQTKTLELSNTGMAVTMDIGESNDIHPKNKQDVGHRLSAIALNRIYGQKMVDQGPTYEGVTIMGNKIHLRFSNMGSGLVAKDKYGYLKGFEIAGPDSVFHYAKAFIDKNIVVVFQDSVDTPIAIRYAWADDAPEANLYNREGFPAQPFRTDDWPEITATEKFTIQ